MHKHWQTKSRQLAWRSQTGMDESIMIIPGSVIPETEAHPRLPGGAVRVHDEEREHELHGEGAVADCQRGVVDSSLGTDNDVFTTVYRGVRGVPQK